jgi:anaerobic ribonucleoside-triphosphate reductase activating protein
MATATWDFAAGTFIEAHSIFEQIDLASDVEGITFLGGEPFEQAEALSKLALMVKASGLSVVTFTGFTYDELLANRNDHIKDLLLATDLLIDGPFIKERFDLSRPWVGSDNQQYRFLSERYNEYDLSKQCNQIEVRIDTNGKTFINGMGDFRKIINCLIT